MMAGLQQPNNSMVSQPMYLANSPGVINTITPFVGDSMNIQESIYEFLDQVMYSQNFKAASSDEKKIEVAGAFLRDRARDWYQRQVWTGIKYGSETEDGSFIQLFVKQFLSDVVLFIKFVPEDESMVTADIVQGLTFESLKGLKSPPTSIVDLEGQLQQADWYKRQELKRDVAIQLSGGNSQLSQFMTSPSMLNYTSMLPNTMINNTMSYGYPNLQPYPGIINQPSDIDSMSVMRLIQLQQQLKLQPMVNQPSMINNTTIATAEKDDKIAALNAKLDKLTLDLENAKSTGKVNYSNYNNRNSNSTSVPSSGSDVLDTINPTQINTIGTGTDEDVVMLSTEEWETQKRARCLQQLALARQRKKELAEMDKLAMAQGLPKPSLLNRLSVSIPLAELLALSSEYNQEVKDALGYSSKKTAVTHNLNSSTPQAGTGMDGSSSFNKGGSALRVAQVGILDRDYDALLDTGTMISITPLDIVKELNLIDKLVQIKPINLSFAGRKIDSACYVLKDVTLLFSDELEVVHSMVVVDFPNFPLMLGNDFIVGANASLDPKRNEIIFDIFQDNDDTEVVKQIIIDTISGTGVNQAIKKAAKNHSSVMTVRVESGVDNQKLMVLDKATILDPLEVTTVVIRCAEPIIIDNLKAPKILVPASSNNSLTLCPTVIHPTRVMETVIANPINSVVTLSKGQVIGVLVPAGGADIADVISKDNIVSDINVIHAYMTEVVDYPDESAAPSVLTSPIYFPPEGISNANYMHSSNLMSSSGPSASINMVQTNFDGYDINPNFTEIQQQQ
ncbi:hypothetical protein HPULCUR_006096 [Helicostylum pulchrum]|uniref:Peptidase A2 domain-containing protein n=1 Tax=Helicostylum pulchrum TaxID=562976 RepID=A0ABP9Y259_9FUNG